MERPNTTEEMIEKIKILEEKLAKNKKMINLQNKTLEEIATNNKKEKVMEEIENKKRALARAKEKFEEKKKKFYTEELDKYEKKLLKIQKINEEEEKKEAPTGSPFECLFNDLVKLCKCPVTGKVMKNPISLPSGRIYDSTAVNRVLKGKIPGVVEEKTPDLFRKDVFTMKLVKLVERYKKSTEDQYSS